MLKYLIDIFKECDCRNCTNMRKNDVTNVPECCAYYDTLMIEDNPLLKDKKVAIFECNKLCVDAKKHKWCFKYKTL